MWRTLRTKLTLLTIAVAVAALVVSTVIALHLATRVLETQARDYADLLAYQMTLHVATLESSVERETLSTGMRSFIKDRDDIAAIDVFFFDGRNPQTLSTQPTPQVSALTREEHNAIQGGRSHMSRTWRDGRLWIAVVSPLPTNHDQASGAVRVWTRVVGLQRLQTTETQTTLLLAALLVGAIFIALKVFLSHFVSRPLERLTAAMQATAVGDLSARTALIGPDEVGQLGAHFNHMLARLEAADTDNRQLMAQLQQINSELEERVASATKDLRARNQDLLRLQREMARVEPLAALGRIMGSIAHELGTPLNSVLGYSQFLAQEPLSPEAQENLAAITSQTRRMTEIIQHYLGRTRDAARHYQPITINTLITNTVHMLNPSFLQQRIDVSTTLAENLPLVHGESASLERVFINVLNNAIDAMADGGRLQITTRASAPPATRRPGVVIEVTDSGGGIPPEVLPHIFEPLVTTKAPGKGTGLGLAICQEIVRSHRGTLAIESTVGQGTCVRIFLPTTSNTVLPTQRKEDTHERTHSDCG